MSPLTMIFMDFRNPLVYFIILLLLKLYLYNSLDRDRNGRLQDVY